MIGNNFLKHLSFDTRPRNGTNGQTFRPTRLSAFIASVIRNSSPETAVPFSGMRLQSRAASREGRRAKNCKSWIDPTSVTIKGVKGPFARTYDGGDCPRTNQTRPRMTTMGDSQNALCPAWRLAPSLTDDTFNKCDISVLVIGRGIAGIEYQGSPTQCLYGRFNIWPSCYRS